MTDIKVIQIGLGPLGIKIAKMIAERKGIKTVAAIDINHAIQGQDIGTLYGGEPSDVLVTDDLNTAVKTYKPDIALLTTVSDMVRITPQIETILKLGLPIISTCEELSHPWEQARDLANKIDTLAKENKVAVLATGVNPGFLMDTLPITLTAAAQDVQHIKVKRYQDAQFRRLPFQKKIGAGLTLTAFEEKMQAGTLRHVGLTESMHMIAARMGWTLDKTEDVLTPVIAQEKITTDDMIVHIGEAAGVRQVGRGFSNGVLKIELIFQAAIGEEESYDEVIINGTPSIHSRIDGGVNGDIATGAIAINAIPRILEATPGLKTMTTIAPVSFFE